MDSILNKNYEEMGITDDYMFCKVFTDNPDPTKWLVEIVTGRKIREIRGLMKQKVIDVVRDRRGVRFDVYFEDDENKKYDFEMQTGRFKDLPKRSRYYQSMIDSDSLNKNASYEMLPDSLICFICTKDPFKHGRMVCTIQNQIMEIGEEFGDGSKTIILYRLVSAMYRLVT